MEVVGTKRQLSELVASTFAHMVEAGVTGVSGGTGEDQG